MEGAAVARCQVRGLWPTTRKMMLRTILMKERWLVTPEAGFRAPLLPWDIEQPAMSLHSRIMLRVNVSGSLDTRPDV